MKYIKTEIDVIDAVRYNGYNTEEILDFIGYAKLKPIECQSEGSALIRIGTCEGEDKWAGPGDYVIKNKGGWYDVISSNEFIDKYEPYSSKCGDGLDFSIALKLMQDGKKMARDGWDGKYVDFSAGRLGDFADFVWNPTYTLHNPNGSFTTYHPSNEDLVAEDWVILLNEDEDDD